MSLCSGNGLFWDRYFCCCSIISICNNRISACSALGRALCHGGSSLKEQEEVGVGGGTSSLGVLTFHRIKGTLVLEEGGCYGFITLARICLLLSQEPLYFMLSTLWVCEWIRARKHHLVYKGLILFAMKF